jgi:ligand-binding sensor domain-containing protein
MVLHSVMQAAMEIFHTNRQLQYRRPPAVRAAMIALLGFFAFSPLAALDPKKAPGEYILKSWNEEDGLPHQLVLALCETRDGYIWLGTQGGLARFDGLRFTVFNSVNTPAIVENSMRALVETKDGTLWVATLRSDVLKMKAGRFERLSQDRQQPQILSPAAMLTDLNYVRRRIVEDSSGRLWIGSSDGIRSVQGETVSRPLAFGPTRALYASSDGFLWLGLEDKGIVRIRLGEANPIPQPIHLPKGNLRTTVIRGDRDGNVWVGTTSGLFRLQPNSGDQVAELLGDSEVEDILEDSRGNLWVATRSGLVQIKDPPFRSLAAGEGLQEAIALVEDHEGTIWFATTQPPYLQRMQGGAAVPATGPLPEGIQTVYERSGGPVLLGANAGLFYLKGNSWIPVPDSPRKSITAIAEDAAGDLWIADNTGSVHRLSRSGVTSFSKADGLSGNRIERLCAARDGNVCVA